MKTHQETVDALLKEAKAGRTDWVPLSNCSVSQEYLDRTVKNTDQQRIRDGYERCTECGLEAPLRDLRDKVLASIRLRGSLSGPMIAECLETPESRTCWVVNQLEAEGMICWDGGNRYVLTDKAMSPKAVERWDRFRKLYRETDGLKESLTRTRTTAKIYVIVMSVVDFLAGFVIGIRCT